MFIIFFSVSLGYTPSQTVFQLFLMFNFYKNVDCLIVLNPDNLSNEDSDILTLQFLILLILMCDKNFMQWQYANFCKQVAEIIVSLFLILLFKVWLS